MKRAENFELVLNGAPVIVIIEPDDGEYLVLLQGRRVARLWKAKANKFVCQHLESGREFGGITRRDAATHMVYSVYKEK